MTQLAAVPDEEHAAVRPPEEWPYRFEVIPLDRLFIDKHYQRPLTTFWKIVREDFQPALVGTLTVAPRGDQYAVIDGQTRVVAMRERGTPAAAPCLVYTD